MNRLNFLEQSRLTEKLSQVQPLQFPLLLNASYINMVHLLSLTSQY